MSQVLIRSSSVGGSADLLGRYKPVDPQEIKQAFAPTRRPYVVQKTDIPAVAAAIPRETPKVAAAEEILVDACCALCKKRIPQDKKDMYVYGCSNLKAYCSHDCRDDQIALDKEFSPPSPSRLQNIAGKFLKRNMFKRSFIRV